MEIPLVSSLTSRFTKLTAIAAATVLLVACLLALSGKAAAAGEAPDVDGADPDAVVSKTIETSPAATKAMWTPEELMKAKPLDDPSSAAPPFDLPDLSGSTSAVRPGDYAVRDTTAIPKRFHGKVFFKIGAQGYSCSGTLISTSLGNAILTAGHCIYDRATKSFVTNPVFIPAYDQGTAPLGIWPGLLINTTEGWKTGTSFSNDIGVMAVAGNPVLALGGGRPLAFNQHVRKRQYTIFGYPADPNPPFNGEHMFGCHSKVVFRDRGKPRPMGVHPCYMSHGASGGGWIHDGYLSAVTSYVYCDTNPKYCGYLFGPYFAKAAKNLFKSVGGGVTPGIIFLKRPPRKLQHNRTTIVLFGLASTPLHYQCKFGHHKYRRCGKAIRLRHIRPGHHVLRVRAYDQTGLRSANTLRTKYRVVR